MAWYERLSSLDSLFLDLEGASAHMHVGALAIYGGPCPRHEEVLALVGSRLDRVPRYRQRLAFVPLDLNRPVWVDDSAFDLEYHVRQTALPSPGGLEPLKRLAGRVFGQRLDRRKPLWELWLVEGVGPDRFAILTKTHHCMIDGISGVDLATVLHDREPTRAPIAATAPWAPRPAPDTVELVADAVRARVSRPFEIAAEALHAKDKARTTWRELVGGMKPLLDISQLGPAPPSSLNRPVGPHRRWEVAFVDLAAVRAVRKAFGGSVNDVLLATVSCALRELLASRGERVPHELRALVPVSVRGVEGRGALGNQVTAVFCPLPVGEADPVEQLHAISKATKGLKEGRQAIGALALTHLREFAPPTLAVQASRMAVLSRWFNIVLTNIPGPQHPLYLLGHELQECYPLVPLAENQTIGVAFLSYNGRIGVGILGDADLARDLPLLARSIPEALRELSERAHAA